MTRKENTVHVVRLALVPVCTLVHRRRGRNWSDLVRVCLDADARSKVHTQELVRDLEPLRARWIVDRSDVDDRPEAGLRMVAEEGQDGDHASRWNVERQFILEDRELLDVLGQALYEIRAVRVKFLRGSGVLSSRRVRRGLFLEGRFGG